MRGHGESPGRRGDAPSCTTLISDVDVCLETSGGRFPGLPQFLLGHSFGGSLVIGYAVGERPGRLAGAVALSPLLRPAVETPRWKLTTAGILARLVPAFPMSTGVDPDALSRRREVVADYRADPLVHGAVSARLGPDILAFGEECIRAAPGLETPMLLMHGSMDRVTSPGASGEFASRAGERCRLVIWEGLYHELHHEPERDDVSSCITGWIEERLEEG
jgi:alpha-beta hydrolase superfamily lysophospholipase